MNYTPVATCVNPPSDAVLTLLSYSLLSTIVHVTICTVIHSYVGKKMETSCRACKDGGVRAEELEYGDFYAINQ